MKKQDLELMSIEQLHTVLDNLGVPYHHKSKEGKLIDTILSLSANPVEIPNKGAAPHIDDLSKLAEHTATQSLKPIKQIISGDYPTVDMVMEAIAPHMQRGLEVVSINTEFFHFRRGAKEDSGNMSQPLRRIVDCASRML